MIRILVLVAGLLLVAAPSAHADSAGSGDAAESSPFAAKSLELQLGVNPYFSIQKTTERRPHIDDVGAHLRFGWMLSSPGGPGFWRGNFEVLAELDGSAVTRGPGNYLAGGALVVRWNFVQPDTRWIPYAQLEAGLLHNDVHDDAAQRVLGQSMEFELGGGLGLRRLLGRSWAVYLEADYRHVSNAGLAKRNLGLNSVGPLLGVARLF